MGIGYLAEHFILPHVVIIFTRSCNMGCIVEFNDGFRFDFAQNKCKQKLWIDVLLRFSKSNIEHLAHILDVPVKTLSQVHQGKSYLEDEAAKCLGQLFLVTFCD